jgi:hypothetical protein
MVKSRSLQSAEQVTSVASALGVSNSDLRRRISHQRSSSLRVINSHTALMCGGQNSQVINTGAHGD